MKQLKKLVILCFVIFVISACGKTTKSKLSHDWKIIAYKETITNGNSSSTTVSTKEMDENTYTETFKGINSETQTSGKVDKHILHIHKDGTWEEVLKTTYHHVDTGAVTTTSIIHEEEISSGYWQFARKDKSTTFKKNERILFFTEKTSSQTQKSIIYGYVGGNDTTNTSQAINNSYTYGMNDKTWIVTESEKGKLALKFEKIDNDDNGSSVHHVLIEKSMVPE